MVLKLRLILRYYSLPLSTYILYNHPFCIIISNNEVGSNSNNFKSEL